MARLTCFPIGNADCTLIDQLPSGKTIVFDFANMWTGEDGDTRIDLAAALGQMLKEQRRNYVDVLAFTHIDSDHVKGSHEFFHFEHADKYGGGYEVKELWVPAAAIVEVGATDDSRIIRAEARHRLKDGKGIKVFSKPEALKDWLEDNDLTIEERRSCFVDAGTYVPTFNLQEDALEVFVHSPFADLEGGKVVERNADAIVVQMTFVVEGTDTKVLFGADSTHAMLSDIVEVTRAHGNDERLEWDVFHLPHHCSYTALGPEKGDLETAPVPNVAWLFEERCREKPILVSPSHPISFEETIQPPHYQSARYYKSVASSRSGKFVVTMEHPDQNHPKPLVILIDGTRARITGTTVSAVTGTVSQSAPRAGQGQWRSR